MYVNELFGQRTEALIELGGSLGLKLGYRTDRQALMRQIVVKNLESGEVRVRGVYEAVGGQGGFVRYLENSLGVSTLDAYTASKISGMQLVDGSIVEGSIQLKEGGKHFSFLDVTGVNGQRPGKPSGHIVSFYDRTPCFPMEHVCLGKHFDSLSNHVVDLIAPIGLGQRCVVAGAPKGGKTMLIEGMTKAFIKAGKHVVFLSLAERPEESTFLRQRLEGCIVVSSSFDEQPERHLKLTETVINYCQRTVEGGEDVVLIIDSLTRYVRASNMRPSTNGKTLSGGLDSNTLLAIKPILGAARNLQGGGSFTIVGTLLIDTGSKMDDVVFDECRSTSNMDITMSLTLANRGVVPPVLVSGSSTRRIELMMSTQEVRAVNFLRQILCSMKDEDAIKRLVSLVKEHGGFDKVVASVFNNI